MVPLFDRCVERVHVDMDDFARAARPGRGSLRAPFGLGEDLDRVKRLNELGVTRVVTMFPPEKADTVPPIVDRWTKIMRQVNG